MQIRIYGNIKAASLPITKTKFHLFVRNLQFETIKKLSTDSQFLHQNILVLINGLHCTGHKHWKKANVSEAAHTSLRKCCCDCTDPDDNPNLSSQVCSPLTPGFIYLI